MELNGDVHSPSDGPEHMSDFIVLGHGSGEFRRNSESESMEEVGLRVRQLLLENKELREHVQQNTEAMAQQYEVLKQWKEQELERQAKIKTQYNNAKEIITALREENARLKQKQEHMERAPRNTEAVTAQTEDENVEQEMLHHQLNLLKVENDDLKKQTSELTLLNEELKQLKQENEELQKKMVSMSQSSPPLKRMTSSSMEVNVASHEATETQTEAPTAESKTRELEVARTQANQLMQDLEALQKLKDDIEQQKAKAEQECDNLMNKIYEKENITSKLLREKREVVAMNNQLNIEVDRLMKENAHLWENEKEKVESLRNYDTVQDFGSEMDQCVEVAPMPSLSTVEKETEEKTGDAELGTTSGAISIRSGDLHDKSQKTIQAILLQLQEQQEANQITSKEVTTKAQQITQLQSELDELKNALKGKDKEIEEAKQNCAKEIDNMVLIGVEKENKAERLAKEEKQKLEEKINSLIAEVTSKVAQLEGLRKHLDNTTESHQKEIRSLNEVNEKCKSEIADQTSVLATLNNSHRQKIEEMRREILHLMEAADDKRQKTMSESHQTELLQAQVNRLITDLRTECSKLETKTRMCNDYKVEADRLSLEIQRNQTKHNESVEAMRLQIGSLRSKLRAAEMEIEKKKQDFENITRSQTQLLADYQDLFTTHDKTVQEKSETETQLRQRMTQLQSESINRQEECKALKDEVRIKQEEIQDLFQRIRTMQTEKEDSSVYQIQAEVFREDFGREREARERAHEELAEAQTKLDDLLQVKQRLETELQRYSQQQISQMQQRDEYVVVPNTYQQPYPQVRQYPHPTPNNEGLDAFGYPQPNLTPPAGGQRPSPSRQTPEKHTCPKCQQEFDDLDTLQIHLFDCLDQ
ncbi:optineurin-like isoform X2 [Lineus longissimus]|uniref:optineurin-like isoform X2 n=1 Tax=Lineus longissimus TaxID=88925 RepID=UPI00315E0047